MDREGGAVPVESESEYEYEYDAEETETFLVDLDVSSLNDTAPARAATSVNSLETQRKRKRSPSPELVAEEQSTPNPRVAFEGDGIGVAQTDAASEAGTFSNAAQSGNEHENSFQMLDLHTLNPIVAYRDQIYSCTWSDMVGTNMFISQPQSNSSFESLRSTEGYDLIGLSRIKLVGQMVKVAPKQVSKSDNRIQEGARRSESPMGRTVGAMIPDGRSLGGLIRTNPRTNIDIKKQATFLEKLMDVKRARGETDNVRTFVTRSTTKPQKRQQVSAKKQKQAKTSTTTFPEEEIQRLNRLVVRGDTEALNRLQDIYSQLDNSDEVEDHETPDEQTHSVVEAPNITPINGSDENDDNANLTPVTPVIHSALSAEKSNSEPTPKF